MPVSLARFRPLIAAAALAGLAACSGVQFPYKLDVRQGNYVTPEMTSQLRVGLNQAEVRNIMGSPLLIDPFHADRWDYVYRFVPGKGPIEERRMTLYFKDGKLTRVEGDVVAAQK
jgi:outer membrane protein assembly factor BamE